MPRGKDARSRPSMPEPPRIQNPPLNQRSRLELHELVIRPEDEHIIVGRVATETFVALPPIGQRALQVLAAGAPIADAERLLGDECGHPIDLVDFATNLLELGFVRRVDDQPITTDDEPPPNSLPWLRPEHCRWLFSLPAKVTLAGLLAAATLILALHPKLIPRTSDFFWSSHISIVLAGNTLIFLAALALHELAHLVAARSLGVGGRFSLGTRLNTLAAQTNMTGLWTLPRRLRYRAYLAGMASDLALLSITVLAMCLHPSEDTRRPLAALALLLALGLASQFQLYMRTDMYFVLADLLKAKNLMEDASAYALSEIRRLARVLTNSQQQKGRDVLQALSARERRNVRVYAPVMVLGSAVTLSVGFAYGLPIVLGMYVHAIGAVSSGLQGGDTASMADGLVTLGVQAGLQGLFLAVLLHNRGTRLRAVLQRLRT